jgi:diketogulonate reductase-like aldo/keto reductase
VLHNRTPPAVNQIEIHPFHQQANAQVLNEEYEVQVEAWGRSLKARTACSATSCSAGSAKSTAKV